MFGQMPNIEDLDNPKSEIASEIISSDGKVIGKYFFQNDMKAEFDNLYRYYKDSELVSLVLDETRTQKFVYFCLFFLYSLF